MRVPSLAAVLLLSLIGTLLPQWAGADEAPPVESFVLQADGSNPGRCVVTTQPGSGKLAICATLASNNNYDVSALLFMDSKKIARSGVEAFWNDKSGDKSPLSTWVSELYKRFDQKKYSLILNYDESQSKKVNSIYDAMWQRPQLTDLSVLLSGTKEIKQLIESMKNDISANMQDNDKKLSSVAENIGEIIKYMSDIKGGNSIKTTEEDNEIFNWLARHYSVLRQDPIYLVLCALLFLAVTVAVVLAVVQMAMALHKKKISRKEWSDIEKCISDIERDVKNIQYRDAGGEHIIRTAAEFLYCFRKHNPAMEDFSRVLSAFAAEFEAAMTAIKRRYRDDSSSINGLVSGSEFSEGIKSLIVSYRDHVNLMNAIGLSDGDCIDTILRLRNLGPARDSRESTLLDVAEYVESVIENMYEILDILGISARGQVIEDLSPSATIEKVKALHNSARAMESICKGLSAEGADPELLARNIIVMGTKVNKMFPDIKYMEHGMDVIIDNNINKLLSKISWPDGRPVKKLWDIPECLAELRKENDQHKSDLRKREKEIESGRDKLNLCEEEYLVRNSEMKAEQQKIQNWRNQVNLAFGRAMGTETVGITSEALEDVLAIAERVHKAMDLEETNRALQKDVEAAANTLNEVLSQRDRLVRPFLTGLAPVNGQPGITLDTLVEAFGGDDVPMRAFLCGGMVVREAFEEGIRKVLQAGRHDVLDELDVESMPAQIGKTLSRVVHMVHSARDRQDGQVVEELTYLIRSSLIHRVARAEAILDAYYNEKPEFEALRFASRLMMVYFKKLAEIAGLRMETASLLGPVANAEAQGLGYGKLPSLPEVADRVVSTSRSGSASFAVDLAAVGLPLPSGGSKLKVVLYNPSDWN